MTGLIILNIFFNIHIYNIYIRFIIQSDLSIYQYNNINKLLITTINQLDR